MEHNFFSDLFGIGSKLSGIQLFAIILLVISTLLYVELLFIGSGGLEDTWIPWFILLWIINGVIIIVKLISIVISKIKKTQISLKQIAIFVIAIILIPISIYGVWWVSMAEGCADGRGTNYYFEYSQLSKFKSDLSDFDISKVELKAVYWQSCALMNLKINDGSGLKEVDYKTFDNFLRSYQNDCNCLMIQCTGWSCYGEVGNYIPGPKYD